MASIFVSLPVPSGPGVGAAVATPTLGVDKSIVVDGPTGSSGELILEGSADGVNFAPITKFFTVDNPPEERIHAVLTAMRVRRLSGGGTAFVCIGAQATSNNMFALLGTSSLLTSAMGPEKTLLVTGIYDGPVVVQSSCDGVNFGALHQFNAGGPGSFHIAGDFSHMRVLSPIPAGAIVQLGAGFLAEAGGGGSAELVTETVTNTGADPILQGQLTRINGPQQVAWAQEDDVSNTSKINGVAQADIPVGEVGVIVLSGKTMVRMNPGVGGVSDGDPLWNDSGYGTNSQEPGNNIPIGTVKDATGFVPGGLVLADVQIEKLANYFAFGTRTVIGTNALANLDSVALGSGADANSGERAIAIGRQSLAAGNSVAIGSNASANNDGGVAIGQGANASPLAPGIAIGVNASAAGGVTEPAIAIGNGANSFGENSVSIGSSASASANDTIVIGRGATAPAPESIAIGLNATTELTEGSKAIAIGSGANALASSGGEPGNLAIGFDSEASGTNSVSIGAESEASAFRSVALGRNAVATSNLGTALGDTASASHNNTLAAGATAAASGENSTAVGSETTATAMNSVAVGHSADATAVDAIAVGVGALASGSDAVGVGRSVIASGSDAVAIGSGASSIHATSIAIGRGAASSLANQCTIGAVAFPIGEFRVIGAVNNPLRAIDTPAAGDTGIEATFFNGVSFVTRTFRAGAGGTGPGGVGRALYIDT